MLVFFWNKFIYVIFFEIVSCILTAQQGIAMHHMNNAYSSMNIAHKIFQLHIHPTRFIHLCAPFCSYRIVCSFSFWPGNKRGPVFIVNFDFVLKLICLNTNRNHYFDMPTLDTLVPLRFKLNVESDNVQQYLTWQRYFHPSSIYSI